MVELKGIVHPKNEASLIICSQQVGDSVWLQKSTFGVSGVKQHFNQNQYN